MILTTSHLRGRPECLDLLKNPQGEKKCKTMSSALLVVVETLYRALISRAIALTRLAATCMGKFKLDRKKKKQGVGSLLLCMHITFLRALLLMTLEMMIFLPPLFACFCLIKFFSSSQPWVRSGISNILFSIFGWNKFFIQLRYHIFSLCGIFKNFSKIFTKHRIFSNFNYTA